MQEIQNAQDRSVLHGQLYSNLDALIEDACVEKEEFDGRTNYYTITDRGYEKPRDRHEWEGVRLEARSTASVE